MGSNNALKSLVKRLKDKENNVRKHAAISIGVLRTDEAFNTLTKIVWKTKDIEILRGALAYADGIGSFKEKCVPFLMEVVKKHKVPDARSLAAGSLGMHGAYIEDREIQEQILEFLIEHHNDRRADVREGCVWGFSYMRNTIFKDFYPKVIEIAFNFIQKARYDVNPKVRREAEKKIKEIERLKNYLEKS